MPLLNLSDWGAVYIMASVGLACKDDEVFMQAVEAVTDKQQAKELSDALLPYEQDYVKEKLRTLIVHTNPWIRVASIETMKHQDIQPDASLMQQLLQDESSEVKVSTLTLIGKQKHKAYTQEVKSYLEHEEESVKYAAAYAGSMLKIPQAYQTLQTFCFSSNPYLREALSLLYHVIKEEKAYEVYEHISKQHLSASIKAYNIAMAGYVDAIPLLISDMYVLENAPYCAEAFCFITGVNLEDEDLIRVENLNEEEEERLRVAYKANAYAQSHEEDLPMPDVELVRQWWRENHQQYVKGTRYLAGKTLTTKNLEEIKQSGTQAQRKVAEIVLSLR